MMHPGSMPNVSSYIYIYDTEWENDRARGNLHLMIKGPLDIQNGWPCLNSV